MNVLIENGSAEIVEKKSRFIADIFYIENIDEAEIKLEEIRKKYYDAKHHCYAYIIGKNGEAVKSSDDGEPKGTAGHPMLDILKGESLTNCIAIVTRYFGGTLLGTGGLVRAYSESLKNALIKVKKSVLNCGYLTQFEISYDDYGKIENLVNNINEGFNQYENNKVDNTNIIKNDLLVRSIDKTFEDVVKLDFLIDENAFDKFKVEIANISKGKIALEKIDKKIYYISSDKEIKYLT